MKAGFTHIVRTPAAPGKQEITHILRESLQPVQ